MAAIWRVERSKGTVRLIYCAAGCAAFICGEGEDGPDFEQKVITWLMEKGDPDLGRDLLVLDGGRVLALSRGGRA